MSKQINILYVWTEDNLRLQGIHYDSNSRNKCVLFIHGMSGNFIENYFAHILGETLSNCNIDFIYSHNRGYNHINDILKKERDGSNKNIRIGAHYDRFKWCYSLRFTSTLLDVFLCCQLGWYFKTCIRV